MVQLAFGVMTARESSGAVAQLVDSLGTRDRVFIHHDYGVQPGFDPARPQVSFVPGHADTGWGTAGFCTGVFRLIRHALASSSFDHFQLLSGSCLPVRSLDELRDAFASGPDLRIDALDVDHDPDVLLTHGHRVYARPGTIGSRLLRLSRRWCFAGPNEAFDRASLGLLRPLRQGRAQRVARSVHTVARLGVLDRMPFTPGFSPWVGSTWFGLSRRACEWLVEQEHGHPAIGYLMALPQCDEILFPTLLMNRFGDSVTTSNHVVMPFDDRHPRLVAAADLPHVYATGRFFARKFSQDEADPVRLAALEHAAGRSGAAASRAKADGAASRGEASLHRVAGAA